MENKLDQQKLSKILNELEINGAGLQVALLYIMTEKKLPEYINLLKNVLKQLSMGKEIDEIQDIETWFKIQHHFVRLLILFLKERL